MQMVKLDFQRKTIRKEIKCSEKTTLDIRRKLGYFFSVAASYRTEPKREL